MRNVKGGVLLHSWIVRGGVLLHKMFGWHLGMSLKWCMWMMVVVGRCVCWKYTCDIIIVGCICLWKLIAHVN